MQLRKVALLALSLCCVSLSLLLPAQAQLGGESIVNPASQPYNVNRDIIERDRRESTTTAPEPKEAPEIKTETEAEATSEDEGVNPTFVLNELLVSGVTVIPADDLQEKFIPWIGKEVGFQDLLLIAADITALYKERGYITTRAVVPPQEIEDGVVQIHVIEGKIGDIEIVGNKYVRNGFIKARLNQDPGEILKLQTLERDIVELNNTSLFDSVRAKVKAGSEPGTSDLELTIDDHFPLHMQLSFDNQGRYGIGLYRSGVTLSHENVLGFGDSATANVSIASGTVSTYGQYKFPLNTHGWNVGGSYAYNRVNLGVSDDPIFMDVNEVLFNSAKTRRITGTSHRFSAFTDFPIYSTMPEKNTLEINGDVSLNFIDSMSYLDGTSLKERADALYPITQNQEFFPITRTLVSGVNFSARDKWGRTAGRAAMTNGIAWMGGNNAFIKWNGNITRIQPIYKGVVAVLAAEGQFTPDILPGVEQMQLGGAFTVRGFQEGYRIADKGYRLSAELHFPLYGTPNFIRNRWEGLVFADHGAVYITGADHHPKAGGTPGALTSYGVGLRGSISQYLGARADMAFVLHPQNNNPDLRVHFGLNSRLF